MHSLYVVFRSSSCFLILLGAGAALADHWTRDQMVDEDVSGRVTYHPRPTDAKFRNPSSPEDERSFQQRARHIIQSQAKLKVPAGNTYFENEKRTYGYLMAQVLGGREAAIHDLQVNDAQADQWHRHTQGIDFYACFTLKHQMRKYFYFGDLLEDAYRQRMFDGAKAWTARDPLRRHHYAFEQAGGGWGPDHKDSWVDVRTTENLFLMRVTSVYLMAEETGNRETAALYKRHILDYARTLYRIGMGEWDSENYHGHSLAPLCNLYDFAKDEEVKLAAKACLDWMCAVGAVKYFRGGFNGPTKRDYNHVQPFGGSAANMLWVYFGDAPQHNTHWESDEVHLITSAYRPPPAVMNLARKDFKRPVELLAAKPHYTATTTFNVDSRPEYLETQYIANSYQMGSLPGGTRPGASDVNGFKILVYNEQHGARALQAVPGPDARYVGSPQYQQGKVSAENRIAQYQNLAIWLVADGKSPWRWVVPESVQVSQHNGVTFLKCDRTWVAIRPLGTSQLRVDETESRRIAGGDKAPFPEHKVLSTTGRAEQYCGFAIEAGERQSHQDFATFRKQALAAEVDLERLRDGIVQYKAADGKWLGFHWNDNPHELGVWRNGKRHDWSRHARYLYRVEDPTQEEPTPPIFARWGEGKLYVESGSQAFLSTVDGAGRASFRNGTPPTLRPLLAE